MSSGLIILVAASSAAAVIVLALMLSKLVRTLVGNASDLAPDFSRLPRVVSWRRRSSRARLGVRPFGTGLVGSAHIDEEGGSPAREEQVAAAEESRAPDDDRALPVGERPADPTTEAASAFPAGLLAPHVPSGRSIDVKQFRQARVARSGRRVGEEDEPEAGREGSAEDSSPAYRQVGEEVTAVLTAAEHAATQIRETALREAERTRVAAAEKASATLAEAQARRAEADDYSEETRAAADAYAEATRRNTDEEAARTVSQAEERARVIQAEAEQKGEDIEAGAIQRRDALTKSTEGMEDKIESMLIAFRGVTAELEELLPPERRSGADEPEPSGDERLDEALRPAPSHGQLSSHADS